MEWTQQDEHYEESDNRRYTVSRSKAHPGAGYVYCAWRRAKPMALLLDVKGTAAASHAVCEEDWAARATWMTDKEAAASDFTSGAEIEVAERDTDESPPLSEPAPFDIPDQLGLG